MFTSNSYCFKVPNLENRSFSSTDLNSNSYNKTNQVENYVCPNSPFSSSQMEENEGYLSDQKIFSEKDQKSVLQSRHSSLQTNETEMEDSIYTLHGTISNTESFSELRFSVSETHSELNYSDSDSWTSQNKPNKNNNQKRSFHETSDYCQNIVDDTTGILYEMSEQINKVPKYLSGWNRSPEHIGGNPTHLESDQSPTQANDSDETLDLEDRVFEYFSQCENLPLDAQQNLKGQNELAELEAAVERMLCQVEIQENLLKEDVNFVPLVLDKKEMKALPLLVDTLCLSPLMQRKQIQEPSFVHFGSTEFNKNDCIPLLPKIVEPTALYGNDIKSIENSPQSCSISELEKSVNRLLNEVEKEEEKLFISSPSPDSRINSSTTDVSSEDDSYRGVWWEGAYRSLPRHSCRRRLTKNSVNQKKLLNISNTFSSKNSQNSDDSDTSKESVKHNINKLKSQSKLIVKTVESGKSAVEIRTCSDFTKTSTDDSSFKFKKMFSKTYSEAHSLWNRSLPSLQNNSPSLENSFARSLGSDDSINYVKYLEPSECIQYFTPHPTMTLDSTGYCTWTQRRLSEGKVLIIITITF